MIAQWDKYFLAIYLSKVMLKALRKSLGWGINLSSTGI